MRMVLLPLLVLAATSTLGHAAFPASGHRVTRSLTSVAFEKANVLRQKQRELANLGFFGESICNTLGFDDGIITSVVDVGTDVGLDAELECDSTDDDVTISISARGDPVCDDGFCIDEGSVKFTIPFDQEGDASFRMCMHYTEDGPANVQFNLAGKTVCFSSTVSIDNLMDDEDTQAKIKSCTASVGAENCNCDVCDDGIGISIECADHGFQSEECADVMDNTATNVSGSSVPGTGGPQIMRMAAIQETDQETDDSAASNTGFPLIAAGFALAIGTSLFV